MKKSLLYSRLTRAPFSADMRLVLHSSTRTDLPADKKKQFRLPTQKTCVRTLGVRTMRSNACLLWSGFSTYLRRPCVSASVLAYTWQLKRRKTACCQSGSGDRHAPSLLPFLPSMVLRYLSTMYLRCRRRTSAAEYYCLRSYGIPEHCKGGKRHAYRI